MGGFRHTAGRFGWQVALCLLVGVVALSATTGVAAADSHADVERTGDTVTVEVSNSSFNGSQSAVVLVNGQEQFEYTPSFSGSNNTTTFEIQRFDTASGSLDSATVNVTSGNETVVSESGVDLRYVQRAGDATLTVDDNGSFVVLRVNESSEVGLEPGDDVPIDVSDTSTSGSVDGTYTGGEIQVRLSDLRDEVSLFEEVTFEPLPNENDVSYAITPSTNATVGIYATENATVLTNPLVFSDTSYDLEVTTSNPDGVYSRNISPETDGQFRLPGSIFYAESISVSIDARDYPNESLSTGGSVYSTNGTWYPANSTLAVDDAPPRGLSAVWLRTNGTVSTVSADRVNVSARTVNLTDTGLSLTNDSTALLVGDETLDVDISVQRANNTTQNPEATNQTMIESVTSTLTENFSIIATLLLTPLVGLITFKLTQGLNGVNTDTVTVGAVAIVLGLGLGVWRTEADPVGFLTFVLLAAAVAGIQYFVWKELSETVGLDSLASVGVGVLVAGLAVGVLAAIKLIALDPSSASAEYLYLVGAGYGMVAAGVWTASVSVGRSSTGGGSTGPPTYDTTIRIEDETGSLVSGRTQVTLTRGNGLDGSQTETITGGSATVALRQGDWTAKTTVDGQTKSARTNVRRAGQRLTIQFSGRTVDITVLDEETQSPIPDATLSVTVDGDQQRHSTDRNGSWNQTYPRSAEQISISVSHDRYETVSMSKPLDDDITGRLPLTPLKGTLVASVTVDDTGVPDIPVELTPRDTALSDGFSGTTDDSGEVTFDDVRIGAYDAVPSLADKPTQFSADSVSVRITENKRTRETLPIRFDYELSGDHRGRIRDLRDRASDIATVSRADDAIPSFYTSVLHELLDTVEDIPNRAHPLLVAGIAPDRVVTAMLSAVEKSTDTVDEVMSSKRNVNLFSTCTDLPSASVTWGGSVSVAETLELSGQEISQQRGELATQLERVEDRIARERSDVAEVSPAQEMLEAVRTMVRDSATASQVESAALMVTAGALLEAIEALFERTQLRDRMERTVY